MKLLFIECQMGAAGDMLMGALLELLSKEEQESFLATMNQLPFPEVNITARPQEKCGIYGTKIEVMIHGTSEKEYKHEHSHTTELSHLHQHSHTTEPAHLHQHSHTMEPSHLHQHSHTPEPYFHHNHSHVTYNTVQALVSDLVIDKKVIADTLQIYRHIAKAEAKAHNKSMEQIHFHEVGTLDAIMDVIGCCLLIHKLAPDRIIVSPIHVGYGSIHCAHGILPVPAPATAEILKGVPIYSKDIEGELCTPTGAAILKHFADEFAQMPMMSLQKTGYGMGTKDFKNANCIRAHYGSTETGHDHSPDQIVEISCNLDDMTPEAIGYTIDYLFTHHPLDIYTTPITMKKNRPATLLTCLCTKEAEPAISQLLLLHTTTKGVRIQEYRRKTLDSVFQKVATKYGDITMKIYSGYGITKYKPEYDEISKAAEQHQLPFQEIYKEVMNQYQSSQKDS